MDNMSQEDYLKCKIFIFGETECGCNFQFSQQLRTPDRIRYNVDYKHIRCNK